MKFKSKYLLIFLLIIILASIRFFEEKLFYDPLLNFFKQDFINALFPEFNLHHHLWSVSLRFWFNSLVSLAILYLIFQKKPLIKIASLMYAIIFLICLSLYYYFIITEFQWGFTAGFYIRRILIQPVLLLLLIPAFWYTEKELRQ